MKRFSYASIATALLLAAGLMTVRVNAQDEQGCDDRVTGGGFILPGGQFANFGAGGGIHQGDLWGYLNFVDHTDSPPMQVSAQEVVGYCEPACVPEDAPPGTECRRITYANATIRIGNTVCEGVTVHVEVCDSGEPGVADTFAICIPDGGECVPSYCAGGVLGGDDKPSGGNIQLHQSDPPCPLPECEDLDECPCFLDCIVEE
jgi:hypothetical protein